MKLIHPELSFKITGICFRTQNLLGRFCREKQYSDLFEKLLIDAQIEHKREFKISEIDPIAQGNIVDFLIEKKVILEIKAKSFIIKEDYYQMQRYLQSVNLELGLIVNFRQYYLKPKRVLNPKFRSDHSDGHSES